jgi:hypothetical protein
MPKVPEFYAINEVDNPLHNRVHHNNGACPSGRGIPQNLRRPGTGGYRHCEECQHLNSQGAKDASAHFRVRPGFTETRTDPYE